MGMEPCPSPSPLSFTVPHFFPISSLPFHFLLFVSLPAVQEVHQVPPLGERHEPFQRARAELDDKPFLVHSFGVENSPS